MPYDPNRHHRRSIRLPGYDYAMNGAYFVTICVQGRRRLFGKIVDGVMLRNPAGEVIASIWAALPQRFPTIRLDAFVVMPDHFHAIVALDAAETDAVPLGDMLGSFKSLTTNAYIQGVREAGWAAFEQRLWQRNFYESIIRDDAGLARTRNYIESNPANWSADQPHLDATPHRFVER